MTNLEVLIAKRRAVMSLIRRHDAKLAVEATLSDVYFNLEFEDVDTREHFRRLDRIASALRKLGLRFEQNADGFSVPYLRYKLGLEAGNELLVAIVTRYSKYFDFWQVRDPKTGDTRMPPEAELHRLAKKLKYRNIVNEGHNVVVDGLVGRAPSCTVSRAFADLYPHGSDADLADFLTMLKRADRGPVRASTAQTKKLAAAMKKLAKRRYVFSFGKARAKDLHLRSHLFGPPYAKKGERWPLNPKTGAPLAFVFQLTDSRVLPKGVGVLQFFYDFDTPAYRDGDPGCLVRTHPRLDPNASTLTAPDGIERRSAREIDFMVDGSLPSWGDARFVYEEDPECQEVIALCAEIDPRASEDVYDRERKRHVKKLDAWSFAGGFARGVQDPPRLGHATFVMQLGSEGKLMWGDCGAVYLLYDGKKRRFRFLLQSS
jgi:hypothetical protein